MHQTFTLVSSYVKSQKNKQQAETLVEPSDFMIQNILNYSKSLMIKKSKTIDFIEIVSN